ncbi:unnamed protein product [Linum tenue]|uniref:Uncharacterized protein n=1 Tax=Linum tenue TaxID=586396 RepID=A0AAV0PMI3_9ROSI|nr:unnamed protein product [Linum tenue]
MGGGNWSSLTQPHRLLAVGLCFMKQCMCNVVYGWRNSGCYL